MADRIGEELESRFLYGELSADEPGAARTRAELRRGGAAGLARGWRTARRARARARFRSPRIHPTAGATLVAAAAAGRLQPQLAPPAPRRGSPIAALIREGGEEGLPGVRAIAVELVGGVAQVSMNVERPLELPLAEVGGGRAAGRGGRRRARRACAARPRSRDFRGSADARLRSRTPPDRERTRLLH